MTGAQKFKKEKTTTTKRVVVVFFCVEFSNYDLICAKFSCDTNILQHFGTFKLNQNVADWISIQLPINRILNFASLPKHLPSSSSLFLSFFSFFLHLHANVTKISHIAQLTSQAGASCAPEIAAITQYVWERYNKRREERERKTMSKGKRKSYFFFETYSFETQSNLKCNVSFCLRIVLIKK